LMSVDHNAVGGADGMISIPVAMESFSNLADAWDLTTEEQINLLGSPGRSTYFKWKKEGGNIPADTMERISHILSIYKSLQILIPEPDLADKWVKRPNEYFGGASALSVMLEGKVIDIYRVRQYLDAQRGG